MNIISIVILGLKGELFDAKDLRRYENAVLNIKAASITAAIGISLFILLF
jgi:hypothetical protein